MQRFVFLMFLISSCSSYGVDIQSLDIPLPNIETVNSDIEQKNLESLKKAEQSLNSIADYSDNKQRHFAECATVKYREKQPELLYSIYTNYYTETWVPLSGETQRYYHLIREE